MGRQNKQPLSKWLEVKKFGPAHFKFNSDKHSQKLFKYVVFPVLPKKVKPIYD